MEDARRSADLFPGARYFAGVSLNGAVIKQDKDSTREFYGHMVTFNAALKGEVEAPAAGNAFLTELAKWAQEAAK